MDPLGLEANEGRIPVAIPSPWALGANGNGGLDPVDVVLLPELIDENARWGSPSALESAHFGLGPTRLDENGVLEESAPNPGGDQAVFESVCNPVGMGFNGALVPAAAAGAVALPAAGGAHAGLVPFWPVTNGALFPAATVGAAALCLGGKGSLIPSELFGP